MNLYLVFIILSMLIGIKVFIKDFNPNFMGKEHTTNVKGIFILIILYSHFVTYTKILITKDFAMLNVRNWLDQLMVAPFLLYSGYGIYESIKAKKQAYVESLPKNRILKTWFHMVFCVLLFLIMDIYLGVKLTPRKIFYSFFGWGSLGNSNWYIFVILCLYAMSYLSFTLFKDEHKKAINLTTLLSIVLIIFLEAHKAKWWYNTILCYPLGLYLSYYKNDVERILMKSNKNYIFALVAAIGTLLVLKEYEKVSTIYYLLLAMAFTVTVVLFSMKINLNSKCLEWFGKRLFWIYMLQRIPMIFFKGTELVGHPYRYFAVCFIITMFLSFVFDLLFKYIDNLIFKPKKVK